MTTDDQWFDDLTRRLGFNNTPKKPVCGNCITWRWVRNNKKPIGKCLNPQSGLRFSSVQYTCEFHQF